MRYHGGGVGHYKIEVTDLADVDSLYDENPGEEDTVSDMSDTESDHSGNEGSTTDTSGSAAPSDEEGDNTDGEVDGARAQENILGYDEL